MPKQNRLRSMHAVVLSAALLAPFQVAAQAGEADVVKVDVRKTGDTYRFSVAVLHADTGWDHYANAFEVVGPDGTVLATRVLAHPHVNEQPFTRSLGNVAIPDTVQSVTVRAVDSVHGRGGAEIVVDLNAIN
ncbi:MAG: hypothetical protein AAFO98_03020 [Pseudomonadota bacterium]